MKRRTIIYGFILCIITISCDKKQARGPENLTDTLLSDSDTDIKKSLKNIAGVYKGEISCDDCEKVELTLKDDNNYSLTLHLSSEEETANNIVEAEGKYSWEQQDSVISLDKYNLRFKAGKKKLYYVDHSYIIDEHEILVKE
ncbi:MAG: copper resistance protein NlpE [Flavobacteriaceae bacterium]|jgi:hypothetical protein|nr:copper resistance protein NlpE [Flavobacteriaceae bacterium]